MAHKSIIEFEPQSGKSAIKLWHQRIRSAQRWRQERTFGDKMFDRATDLIQGRHWSSSVSANQPWSDDPSDQITVNITAAAIQDFWPFLVRQNPEFMLLPTVQSAVESAKTASAWFNYSWREHSMQKQFRRAVYDLLGFGHGVVKTGWTFELREGLDPTKAGNLEYRDWIKKDAPFIRRVNPRLFMYDPASPDSDLESARWAIETMFVPAQDVLFDKEYSKALIRKVRSGQVTPTTIKDYHTNLEANAEDVEAWSKHGEDSEAADRDELWVIHQVWDRKFDKQTLLLDGAEDSGLALREMDNPYDYLDGHCYSMGKFVEYNDEHFSHGIPMLMRDQQLELNRIRTTEFIERRKHGKRKWAITENGIEGTEIKNLLNDADYVKVLHTDGVKPLDSPALPADNYRTAATIRDDVGQLLGLDELQRGGALPGRTSAREIQARQAVQGTKTGGRVALVDEFLDSIGRQ
ncbi:MAG: portal protein, partial [Planctomycetota bacterium]